MKRTALVLSITTLCFGFWGFKQISKTGKVGYTGSPGESKCNNCHNTYSLNSGDGFIKLYSDMPNNEYTPGTTYHLSVVVGKPTVGLFGFDLEALTTSNANAGTLTVTNSTIMQKLNAGNGRANLTHKLNGGSSPDSAVFSFDWVAPVSYVGDVTFYYTGVCGNANNSDIGDYVYSGSKTFTGINTAGIEQNTTFSDFRITAVTTEGIQLRLNLISPSDMLLNIFSMDGRLVSMYRFSDQAAGIQYYTLPLKEAATGVYVLKGSIGKSFISQKFTYISH